MEKRSYAQPERPAISAAAIEMAYLTSSFCKTEKACFVLLLMASSTATEMLRPQGSGAAGHQKMRGEVKHMQLGALRANVFGDIDLSHVIWAAQQLGSHFIQSKSADYIWHKKLSKL